jgi:hypothetical protein
MYEAEIKRIGIYSTFKFFASLFMIIGLVQGLWAGIAGVGVLGPMLGPLAMHVAPLLEKGQTAVIFVGLFIGTIVGLFAGLGFAALAVIYNFFVTIVGGINLTIEEK